MPSGPVSASGSGASLSLGVVSPGHDLLGPGVVRSIRSAAHPAARC
jgi:hypothetical protein